MWRIKNNSGLRFAVCGLRRAPKTEYRTPRRGFTPLHPESPVPLQRRFVTGPAFQSGDEWHIKIKLSRKPRLLRRGVTGFTLVELLVVAFMVSIIAAAIFGIFLVGRRAWFIGSTQVTVQEEARRAIDRMSAELFFSSFSTVDISAAKDQITFCKPETTDADGQISWSQPIQYSLSNGQILRTFDSQSSVLANNITSLYFSPLYSDGLEIKVIAQRYTIDGRNIESTLGAQLYFRN